MKKSRIQSYLVLDVETGGIPKGVELAVLDVAITEIALVMVSPELEIIGEYSSLIKPYSKVAKYDAGAAAVSGITKEDCIAEGKDIKEVVKECIEFINTYKAGGTKPVMVGHNIKSFDAAFVENTFLMGKADLYKHVQEHMVDTMEECYKIFPEAPDFKLGTMCGQFDIELTQAHRALPDTLANTELWIGILSRARGEGMSGGVDSMIPVERLRTSEGFNI